MDNIALYVGIVSGICTGVSQVPQLIKIIREKEAENISYITLCILLIGVSGWTWYGALKKDLPIILTNSFSCVMTLFVIGFSAFFKSRRAHSLQGPGRVR